MWRIFYTEQSINSLSTVLNKTRSDRPGGNDRAEVSWRLRGIVPLSACCATIQLDAGVFGSNLIIFFIFICSKNNTEVTAICFHYGII